METALYVLHVLVCLAMLPIILLQSGKGGGVSAVFGGGGGNSVMGTRGASNFLSRMTTGAAIIFMCTSLGLSVMSSRPGSVVEGLAPAIPENVAPPGGDQAAAPASLPPITLSTTAVDGSEAAADEESGEPTESDK